MQIGFIGLGIMGRPMARNLLKSGHDLVVYNRTPAKAESLLTAGAAWADTPAEAAEAADVLITMVSTPAVIQTLAMAEDGFLSAMPRESRWMRKDLQLAAQSAYEQGVALPALNAIKEIYALAEKDGLGKQDFAAVWQFLAG